jgi:hypothetical protein
VEEQLQHAAEYEAWRTAGNTTEAPGNPSKMHGVKRTSILYRLPYWKVYRILTFLQYIQPHSIREVFILANVLTAQPQIRTHYEVMVTILHSE